jgi:DNA-binding CsgD family transcriptional regulator
MAGRDPQGSRRPEHAMKQWTVLPSTWSGTVDGRLALAAVELAGRPGFAEGLLREIDRIACFDHCTVFRFADDRTGRPGCEVVDAASRHRQATAQQTSALYADRFANLDPNLRCVERGAGAGDAIHATHFAASELPHADYRDACYVRNGLIDRVSLMGWADTRRAVSLNFYRSRRHGQTTRHECAALLQASPILLRAAMRHADALDPTRAPGGADLLARLADASALTPREREVIALVLDGASVAEAAARMGVRPSTAITLKKRGFGRLRVRSKEDLLRRLAA